MLDEVEGDNLYRSQFYLLCSDLHRIQGKSREFYATSLKYLVCNNCEDLCREKQAKHIHFLATTAILGGKVYIFGGLGTPFGLRLVNLNLSLFILIHQAKIHMLKSFTQNQTV